MIEKAVFSLADLRGSSALINADFLRRSVIFSAKFFTNLLRHNNLIFIFTQLNPYAALRISEAERKGLGGLR